MSNSLRVTARSDAARARAALGGPLPFGKVFADLMVRVEHNAERGWHAGAIVPFGPLELSPAAKVLHYSQEIFEGQKAYAWPGGRVALFRPELNARRLNRSARRMVMPEVPEELQLEALELLVDLVRGWVPREPGTALYLRPALLGIEPTLGIAPSAQHLYLILAAPVGAYFQAGAGGIAVRVEEREVRAFPGGVGAAKTGGNYAAGLRAQQRAKAAGFDQVLFLGGGGSRRLEEMNGMNVFAVVDGVVCTPPLGDTVLDGITRRSLLELAPALGLRAEERELPLDELLAELRCGRVSELFTSGTGAGLTAVGLLGVGEARVPVGQGGPGPVTRLLGEELSGIQQGRRPDRFGWMRLVGPHLPAVAEPRPRAFTPSA
jgi:branched-chain amino acid aminotransferase